MKPIGFNGDVFTLFGHKAKSSAKRPTLMIQMAGVTDFSEQPLKNCVNEILGLVDEAHKLNVKLSYFIMGPIDALMLFAQGWIRPDTVLKTEATQVVLEIDFGRGALKIHLQTDATKMGYVDSEEIFHPSQYDDWEEGWSGE